jgi:hypothetical protein
MNIISFSLWGSHPMYWDGAIENISLAKEYYPNWICRFYIDASCNEMLIKKIQSKECQTILVSSRGLFDGAFWRFLALDDPSVDIMISRDCDSRLNIRESLAVNEWLKSEKLFHTMHDHPAHLKTPILAGMWGCKKGLIQNITEKIKTWNQYQYKGGDQKFLEVVIWPTVKDTCFRHVGYCNGTGHYGKSKPFPKHNKLKYNGTFVGEIFDELNQPNKHDIDKLRRSFK